MDKQFFSSQKLVYLISNAGFALGYFYIYCLLYSTHSQYYPIWSFAPGIFFVFSATTILIVGDIKNLCIASFAAKASLVFYMLLPIFAIVLGQSPNNLPLHSTPDPDYVESSIPMMSQIVAIAPFIFGVCALAFAVLSLKPYNQEDPAI